MRIQRTSVFLCAPAIFGAVLLAVSLLDLHQFGVGSIEPRTMLYREVPFVVLGLLSSLALACAAVWWCLKRRWRLAFASLGSILVFLICFSVAGALGAAFLNAT
jgi:NO-binding membrane sensor protein with MHYT domain